MGSYISQNATQQLDSLHSGLHDRLSDRKLLCLHSRCVVVVTVPAAIAAFTPLLVSFLLSCCLLLRLLFLPGSPLQVFLLLLPDLPLDLLQSLQGSNPLRPADLRPVQTLRTETHSRDVNSGLVSLLKTILRASDSPVLSISVKCHKLFDS